MPIIDSGLMLRDGSVAVSGAEDGDWKLFGQSPYGKEKMGIFLPSDGTSITIVIQQADDSNGTNAETVPVGSPAAAITTGAKLYEYPLLATRPYLRYRITAVTGTWGAVQIGPIMGQKPVLP